MALSSALFICSEIVSAQTPPVAMPQVNGAPFKIDPKDIPKNSALVPSVPPVSTTTRITPKATLKKPDNLPIQSATSTMKMQEPVTEQATTTQDLPVEKKSFFSQFIAFFKNLFSGKK